MQLIGHRGARGEAPENTLSSFRHLHALGIQRVEFDLRLSKDKQIVIIHDDTLERTTNGTGLVSDFYEQELKQLDACAKFDASLASEGVPTLTEVLAVFDHLQHAQLEVKPLDARDHETMCKLISETLKQFKLEHVCVITSSDIAFLESCKKFCPHLKRGYIYFEPEYNAFEVCEQHACSLLALYWKFCSKEVVEKVHAREMEISVWTVNETTDFKSLVNMGVDSIITDFPAKMLPLIQSPEFPRAELKQ